MPIDHNIILRGRKRSPSPLESISQVMTLRQLANREKLQNMQMAKAKRETRESQAVRDSFKGAMIQGEDGSITLDRKKALSDLYKAAPERAYSMQQSFDQGDRELQKQKLSEAKQKIDLIGSVFGGVKDQESHSFALNAAKKYGLDTSDIPEQFDPNVISRVQAMALDYGEQINQRLKAQESANQKNEKKKATSFKNAKDLRTEWLKDPMTKKTQEVAAAYEKVRYAAENPSAAGDLALVFNYMKILDPGSVVRESEFRSAAQARSALSNLEEAGVQVPAFVVQGVQKLQTGEFLLPEQRLDFANAAGGAFQGQMAQQRRFNEFYTGLAGSYGINPDEVLSKDLFKVGEVKKPQKNNEAASSGKVIKHAGKLYRVGEDGDTLIPLGSTAENR